MTQHLAHLEEKIVKTFRMCSPCSFMVMDVDELQCGDLLCFSVPMPLPWIHCQNKEWH